MKDRTIRRRKRSLTPNNFDHPFQKTKNNRKTARKRKNNNIIPINNIIHIQVTTGQHFFSNDQGKGYYRVIIPSLMK